MEKIVSLLYNKEKAFQCIFRHKCKQIGLFIRVRFSLDLAVFMDGNLPNSFSAA